MLFHSLSVRPHWPWRQDICGHLPQSLGCEYRPQMYYGHFPQRWCFKHHQQRCQGGHLPPRVSLKCEVQGGLSHQKVYGTVPQRSSGKLILFSSPWIWAMRAAFITLSSLIVLWSCLFSSLSWKLRSSRSACSTAATFAHVLHWSDVLLCCSSAFFQPNTLDTPGLRLCGVQSNWNNVGSLFVAVFINVVSGRTDWAHIFLRAACPQAMAELLTLKAPARVRYLSINWKTLKPKQQMCGQVFWLESQEGGSS